MQPFTARRGRAVLALAVLVLTVAAPPTVPPNGALTFDGPVTLAARWLDTAETDTEITPLLVLYALPPSESTT